MTDQHDSTPQRRRSETIRGARIQDVLDVACNTHAPVFVASADVSLPASVHRGTFRAMRDGVVVVHLDGPSAAEELANSTCVATFRHGSRVRSFLVPVVGTDLLGTTRVVLLGAPTEILGADARTAFRVPMLDPTWVTIRVRHAGATMPAKALDLSLTGTQLELEEASVLALRDVVTVDLARGSHSVRLEGEIRRACGTRYGIFFRSVLRGSGRVEPPEALISIVREVERLWLQERTVDDI